MADIHIIGGGTFSPVRNHLALAAPAFGNTARQLHQLFSDRQQGAVLPTLHLTKMADSNSSLVTNDDVSALLDRLVANPNTRVIILNAALCDYTGAIIDRIDPQADGRVTRSGSHETRLKTSHGTQEMLLTPADKLLRNIRKIRKDIFLVAFKTTTGASSDEQYRAGLDLLKGNSANLVFANDTVTRNNMIITPEEARYAEGDRDHALSELVKIVLSRMTNTFTRSTVVEGDLVDFQSDPRVPDNLRTVVNHLVSRGAYKEFRNATVGHFAVRVDDGRCLTSRRKTNYTVAGGLDLVEVEYDGAEKVVAHGAKPSVGGQSQRIVFAEHPDLDCIVHAHIPLRENPHHQIPLAEQWMNECGSQSCGENVSNNLQYFGKGIHAVMLDNHGPNIVFSRTTAAEDVIDFIEANFAVEEKTGGLVE